MAAERKVLLSPDGKCRVECYEEEKAKHSVSVEEDTLVIKVIDKKSWYDYIGIHFGTPKMTVYLPKTEYALLSINEETGDVKLPKEFKFRKAEISLSTGDVMFDTSDGKEIYVETDTGEVEGSLLTDKVFITETSTGRIDVPKSATGGKCEVTTSTGDIKLEVLS